MRINMGCGKEVKEGYVNLDFAEWDGVDIVHDLNKTPYPFEDDSVSEILCLSVLEHLRNEEGFINECYRILKKGGVLKIHVPYYNSSNAIRSDHVRFFYWGWHKTYTANLKEWNSLHSAYKTQWALIKRYPTYFQLGKIIKFFFGKKVALQMSRHIGDVIGALDFEITPIKFI